MDVVQHMFGHANVGLLATRQTADAWDCLATSTLCGHKACAAYDINSLFPLYLYPAAGHEAARRPNLSDEFCSDLGSSTGLRWINDGNGDLAESVGPDDTVAYIYAAFHSPRYRARYAEFLRTDFPRIPRTSDRDLFRELCRLGARLVTLHLMEADDLPPITTYPVPGDNRVEKLRYTEPGQGAEQGRVWINITQYFEGVQPEVWEFHVGGYQVCAKWLKDRKGRQLSYDDLTHYQYVVAALAETISLMREIDEVIEAHGGWPLS